MYLDLAHLFCRHASASFDKQCHFWSLIEGMDWHFELATGMLSFGGLFQWRADILGTESDESSTWLWAWANKSSDIPKSQLHAALHLKELGERSRIPELCEAEIPVGEIDGEFLAMLASGECRAKAYFRAPYDGGAAYMLIMDERFQPAAEPPLSRVAAIFPQVLVTYDIPDHKAALAAYLEYYGLQARSERDARLAANDASALLTATFDDYRRLTQLNVTSSGETNVELLDRKTPPTQVPTQCGPQNVAAPSQKQIVAFGPEMPGWGSWEWIGDDLRRRLGESFATASFRWETPPAQIHADVIVIVKHVPPTEFLVSIPGEARLIFCPVDLYGSAAEIDADSKFLRRCARIVIHCERLCRYFEPYAPVVYLDHHLKFAAPLRQNYRNEG